MKQIYLILFLLFSLSLFSQVPTEQDCMGAIPVCQNVYSQSNSYSGVGNYTGEISTTGGCPGNCLLSGELNDVWYIFTVQQSGNLSFTITPNSTDDDYDWAVYNLTNNECSEIATNTSLQVSCNYSDQYAPTGANGGTTSNCGDAVDDPDNAVIPVLAGQTYVLNVSNYSSSQYGYTLDFGASTAVIFDNIPPYILSLDAIPGCGATTITFDFSENVLCNTVSAADFSVVGPGGPYTVTGVSGYACGLGGTQEKTFTITVTPAITASGNYQICLNDAAIAGSVADLCGNIAPAGCLNFTVTNVTTTMTHTDENCGAGDGTATVTASGGSGTYTYTWSTTPPQNSQTATGLSSGTYYVTVSDGACSAIDTVQINSIGGPSLSISGTDDACSQGVGTATVNATGGTGSYTYTWNTTPPQNTPTATGLTAGTYTVTVDDGGPCPSSISVIIGNTPGPTLSLVSMTPENSGAGDGSATVSASGGTLPYTYTWNTVPPQNGPTASNLPAGNYTVTVEDDNGCTATLAVTVTSVGGGTLQLSAGPEHCGQCDGQANVVVNNPIGAYTVLWSNGEITETITGLCTGTYTVTVTDQENTYIQGIFVPNIAGPTASFIASPNPATIGEDAIHFMNQSLGGSTFIWTFGDGNSSTQENPVHSYNSIGDYTVWLYVYDDFGCMDSMSMVIIVQDVFTLYIPNVFSPNGDGINDYFMPQGMGVGTEDYHLRIFDRWGQMVFYTTSPNVYWDGNINDVEREKKPIAVYTYVLDFKDRAGLPHQKYGVITAIY